MKKGLIIFGSLIVVVVVLVSILGMDGSTGVDFSLIGSNDITVKQDRAFVDPGFIAENAKTNESLSSLVAVSSEIDTSTVGTTVLTYTLEYEEEVYTLERTVRVVPALTQEMAFNFFSNVDLSLMEFFPDSFRETIDVDNIVFTTNCVFNDGDKFDFNDEEYDYCTTSLDNNLPMSDVYIDIYSSMKQFELIEKYTNTILHSMDSVSDATDFDEATVTTPYGSISMGITDEITDDSVTFMGNFSYTQVVDVELLIKAELTYDYTTELYKVRYGYDVAVGYSFFGVTIYNMYAEAIIDKDYNLLQLDIYNNIPTISTKATSLTIVDNSTVEMLSYFSVVGLFESKAYIYANDAYGYSYKMNDALGFDPKTYYNVFTDDTMVFSYEVKADHEESKYYLTGLNGWKEAYYLIDVFGPNNKLDSAILLDDDSFYLLTEEDFDDDPTIGYTIQKEDSILYYYSEETDDIEEYKYEADTFYFYQDSNKGSIDPFTPPFSLSTKVPIDIEDKYDEVVADMNNYRVLGVLLFSVSGFDFDIPLEVE